mmetsp:Transcript_17794/g.26551  ORF Transcript_17794/g.26551 Transcript_17794/m.26551 type:complete len:278 (-) Transcript_17794:76-909(-)
MAPLNTTRTLFEVRVGAYHTIEVLLQIRQSDISWWNSDLKNHERQLHKLLGRRVLPVECREEIEEFHSKRRIREERKAGFSEAQKDGKKKVVVGEANLKKKASRNKRGNASTKDKKKKGDAKSQKKQKTADNKKAKGADDVTKEKRSKPFQDPGTWIIAPGYTIQLCYNVEEIESTSTTTLVFRPKKNMDASQTEDDIAESNAKSGEQTQTSLDDNDKKVPLASFRKWTKLKKRVNVWVFKLDSDNPCDLSHSEGGGFPRPDLLPMADIFRTIGDNE